MRRVEPITPGVDKYTSVKKVNEIIAEVNRLGNISVSGNLTIMQTKSGISLRGLDSSAVSYDLQSAEITEVFDDYLSGTLHSNGTATTASIIILKPRILRRSLYDNQVLTYMNGDRVRYLYSTYRTRSAQVLADDGTVLLTEAHVQCPDYYLGEVIDILPVYPVPVYDSADSPTATYLEFSPYRGWVYVEP